MEQYSCPPQLGLVNTPDEHGDSRDIEVVTPGLQISKLLPLPPKRTTHCHTPIAEPIKYGADGSGHQTIGIQEQRLVGRGKLIQV
jgi:hypothetical protein